MCESQYFVSFSLALPCLIDFFLCDEQRGFDKTISTKKWGKNAFCEGQKIQSGKTIKGARASYRKCYCDLD